MLHLTAVESAIMGKKSQGEELTRRKQAVKKLQFLTLRLVYPDLGDMTDHEIMIMRDLTDMQPRQVYLVEHLKVLG